MKNFGTRLFGLRNFAFKLFRGVQADQTSGGFDWRWLAHGSVLGRVSPAMRKRIEDEPAEVVEAVARIAETVEIHQPERIGQRLAAEGIEPVALYVELYLELLSLRTQRDEEAAIAACIAALV